MSATVYRKFYLFIN